MVGVSLPENSCKAILSARANHIPMISFIVCLPFRNRQCFQLRVQRYNKKFSHANKIFRFLSNKGERFFGCFCTQICCSQTASFRHFSCRPFIVLTQPPWSRVEQPLLLRKPCSKMSNPCFYPSFRRNTKHTHDIHIYITN